MPAGYEKMRDKFAGGKKSGPGYKLAQKKAAMIWNSKHKGGETVGKGRD
jgi:hypothetical protein